MLELDPKANINPFVLVSELTGGGFDVLHILKKPNPRERHPNPVPTYSFECEMILRARLALQQLDGANPLRPILNKFAKNDYDFYRLSYAELREVRMNEDYNYDPSPKEGGDKNYKIAEFCNFTSRYVAKAMEETSGLYYLTNDLASSVKNLESLVVSLPLRFFENVRMFLCFCLLFFGLCKRVCL